MANTATYQTPPYARQRHLFVLLAALVTVMAGVFALAPATALAKSYEISAVNIDAAVSSDGQLSVTETRTFDFDGHYNGVYWDIPCGYNSSNGKDVQIAVGDVLADGTLLTQSDSGANNTYSVSQSGSVIRLKIYSSHEDEKASFTINYTAAGIVTRWSDTSELYWKFVSDGWDVESQNVTCTLTLPVAAGQTVSAGDNVRAWGHGPLDGSVDFDSSGKIVFKAPGVGTEEYAEMRVTFPTSWLAGLEETSGTKLDSILSEEQQWADEANAKRNAARMAMAALIGGGVAVAVLSVLLVVKIRLRYNREHEPVFQDKYFRDVPTNDHPAVLGALYNGGEAEAKEFTASLMHLTDAGVISLRKATIRKKGVFGKEKQKEDFELAKVKSLQDSRAVQALPKEQRTIDSKVNTLLYGYASKRKDADGHPVVAFSRLETYAEKNPDEYSGAYKRWCKAVQSACLTRFYGTGKSTGKGKLIAVGCVDIVLAIAEVVFLIFSGAIEANLITLLIPVALIAVGVVAIVTGVACKDVNKLGVETIAQLKALRAWLLDFTHLDEAVPTDVVLWNRLLVMAVVLDVADEVVKQLKVVAPELLEDPYLAPTYGWYYWGWGPHTPVHAFSDCVKSAHEVSVANLASSSSSSGGGGGGGFSSGGGGGFGGGGGGGAF